MSRDDTFTKITNEYVSLVENPEKSDPSEDSDMDTFSELFKFPLSEMARVYKMHRKNKGDSWKAMSPETLRDLLKKEMVEFWSAENDSKKEYDELIDLLNVSFMLMKRLAEVCSTEE